MRFQPGDKVVLNAEALQEDAEVFPGLDKDSVLTVLSVRGEQVMFDEQLRYCSVIHASWLEKIE